ncbi:MAG: hypothetical protein Q7T33_04685 [Dehalococcoidia bacterium]|nr:hypothetical protein [Dehalococcoidia bacterium]
MSNLIEARRFSWPARLAALAIAATLFLVLASACGGDDDSETTGTIRPTATSTGRGQTPGGAEETPGASGDQNGGDAGDELKTLGKEWSTVSAKITYEFHSTFQGTTTETTMTFYSRPPDSRVDYETASVGKSIFIDAGGKSYICSDIAGQGQCLASPSEGSFGSALPFFGDLASPDSIDSALAGTAGVTIDKFEDKIAGQDASCFKASGTFAANQGESSWCFADDGLLLSSEFKGVGGAGDFSMKATEVSRNVSDDDFKPPFDVAG